MEETSAQTTSLVFFFKPILAPILALILLHEAIPLNMLIGILFILFGSLSSILPGLIPRKSNVLNVKNI
jgi:drug/metabolite transporter (DMT)-like permease